MRRQGKAFARALLAGLLAPASALAQGHEMPEDYAARWVAAALEQTRTSVTYDGFAYPITGHYRYVAQ